MRPDPRCAGSAALSRGLSQGFTRARAAFAHQAAGAAPAYAFDASFEVLDAAKDVLTVSVMQPGALGAKGASCSRGARPVRCLACAGSLAHP
jgi:hypothetical protein